MRVRFGYAIGLAGALAFLTPSSGMAAPYSPLDCAKAATPSEIAICQNYSLGQSEARLATLYAVVTGLVAMGQRGDIMDAQRQWLVTRNACGNNAACLAEAYKARIGELSATLDDIASRGPY